MPTSMNVKYEKDLAHSLLNLSQSDSHQRGRRPNNCWKYRDNVNENRKMSSPYLSVPTAQHWSRISQPAESGLSLRSEGLVTSLSFQRLDRHSQRVLIKNVKQTVSSVCKGLRRIHRISTMRAHFMTWRVKMEYDIQFTYANQFRYRAKAVTLLKTAFMAWKYAVSIGLERLREQKFGVLSLYSMLYHTRKKKLKKYLQKWSRWNKSCGRMTQRSLDLWVIFTYKAKLAKCNALCFVKHLTDMSIDHSYRKRKGSQRFFFHVWKQKTTNFNNITKKQRFFHQWRGYHYMLLEKGQVVAEEGRGRVLKRGWRGWRVLVVAASMCGYRGEKLKLQYFRRWARGCRARADIGALLVHLVSRIEERALAEEGGKERGEGVGVEDGDVSGVEESHTVEENISGSLNISLCDFNMDDPSGLSEEEVGQEGNCGLQKQLFLDEAEVASRGGKGRYDLSHLKIRVTATHDLVQQYEARRIEREKLKKEKTKIRSSIVSDSGSSLRYSRNSKNYDSYYS